MRPAYGIWFAGGMSGVPVTVTVNDESRSVAVDPRRSLLDMLRETLGLTGTHVGCDTTQCGACTIHLNGQAVKSCTVLAAQADGDDVLTIEGLANGADLHPMQAAFKEHHGLQCGFCTPGMIMAAIDIVNRHGGSVRAESAPGAGATFYFTLNPDSDG